MLLNAVCSCETDIYVDVRAVTWSARNVEPVGECCIRTCAVRKVREVRVHMDGDCKWTIKGLGCWLAVLADGRHREERHRRAVETVVDQAVCHSMSKRMSGQCT